MRARGTSPVSPANSDVIARDPMKAFPVGAFISLLIATTAFARKSTAAAISKRRAVGLARRPQSYESFEDSEYKPVHRRKATAARMSAG